MKRVARSGLEKGGPQYRKYVELFDKSDFVRQLT